MTTINSICHRRRAPTIIRQTLQTWISSWLQCATLDRTNLDPRLLPLFDAQNEIGWDLLVRGFYAKEWSLISPVYEPHRKKPYNHDFLFFPKLITEIWDLQLQFWRQYQENRHTDSPTPTETSASLSELQAQIRHLYTLSDQVLQTQRPRLFPPDIDVFLDTNNMSQLQAYISQYTPAIRLSIRQATKRSRANTRSLHSYGFTPQTNTSPNTQPTHIPPSTVPPPPDVPPPIPDTNLNLPTLHRPRLLQRLLTWANIRTPTHTQSPPSLDDHPTQSGTETTPRTTIQSPQPSTQDPPRSTHTRAPHHKHSRWRPPDLQRQQFLNFFRR